MPTQLPEFPVITGLMFKPPKQSTPVVIGTSNDRLNLWADANQEDRQDWVSDIPGKFSAISSSVLRCYWGNIWCAHYLGPLAKLDNGLTLDPYERQKQT